mmetsp:Transcript_641/g.808  ORF Transcript_641/g.808 Transcript_641/m.808 type:complete len:261 (+) Transcript_641:31-813(+)|eukprot:CAMPEP_0178913764 /NCGR_PEP_ID=MMETSP0786-20121207/11026_1 /TAXON_ID=186022 /ORGANISM="Thalassionema frauenfeldii, Strain CCMP 1798" /LENGTH=260 /DNA_ID=CAMNT_0020586547 /DNA_START=31 /DNA_END=813 /DNA_ORIENTATION=+
MSFQDVGKSGGPQRPHRSHLTSASTRQSTIPENNTATNGSNSLAQLSDGILQYQRNVGILEKIARQIGTPADGAELQTQFDVQVDVLNQLGQRLENTLRRLETDEQGDRTEAAKRRATLVKLGRDYRRIETSYKNILLEAKRKKSRLAAQKQNQSTSAFSYSQKSHTSEEEQISMQLQMQQDVLNEEIMREREHEIRNINHGMHQVNEIYKDLAHVVASQQDQVDQIETQMEQSKINAEQGLSHIQKANEKASSSQCTIS